MIEPNVYQYGQAKQIIGLVADNPTEREHVETAIAYLISERDHYAKLYYDLKRSLREDMK